MRRLLSPVRLLVIHTSRRRGLGSPLPPPLFLGFSLLVSDPWGWSVAAVPPQPLFGGDARVRMALEAG
jgi:hypothetical protein